MKKTLIRPPFAFATRLVAALAVTLLPTGALLAQDGSMPTTSYDGLELVPDSKAAAAYVRPGADFSGYDQILLLDCYVAFNKDWQKNYNRDSRSLSRKVSDSDVTRMKEGMAELFKDVFVEELSEKGGYTLSETPAENVLLIRPAIIDLQVTAPDTRSAERSYTFVNSAGAATLYIELYDSVSGEILARAVDRKAGRDYGRMEWSTSSSNRAEARRIVRRWAGWLREGLDEVRAGDSD